MGHNIKTQDQWDQSVGCGCRRKKRDGEWLDLESGKRHHCERQKGFHLWWESSVNSFIVHRLLDSSILKISCCRESWETGSQRSEGNERPRKTLSWEEFKWRSWTWGSEGNLLDFVELHKVIYFLVEVQKVKSPVLRPVAETLQM